VHCVTFQAFQKRSLADPARPMNKVQLGAIRFRRKRMAKFGQFEISANKTLLRLGAQAIPDTIVNLSRADLIGYQNVAAPRQGPQSRAVHVTQGSADIPDRLNERIIGHHAVSPDFLKQIILFHEPPRSLRQES
jgi:hypothetical protein